MYILFILAVIYAFMRVQRKLYAENWDKNLYVNVAFEKNHVTEGEENVITESVINNKWLPLPFLYVNFKLEKSFKTVNMERVSSDDKFTRDDLINVLMKQSIKRKIRIQCCKRGYYGIDKFSIKTFDLFLKDKFMEEYAGQSSLTVYPKTVDTRRFRELLIQIDGEQNNENSFYDDCFQIRGCREYQPYDGMKYINWKASARTNEWKVNVFEKISNNTVFLFLNLESLGVFSQNEVLEESIRLAKSFAMTLSDKNVKSCLITNGKPKNSENYVALRQLDQGPAYVNRVDEALAAIDLSKSISGKTEAVKETFCERYCEEIMEASNQGFVILISNSHEKNLCDCMWEMKRAGKSFAWITPVESEADYEKLDVIAGNEYMWRLHYEGARELVE